jgi:hypothetical protein
MPATGERFTPVQQQIYLGEMRRHGRIGLAAEAAGTTSEIVAAFKKNFDADGWFANAETLALQIRSETISARLENEFLEGVLEPILGPDGKQMMVKVIDPDSATGYREIPGWKRKLESAARLRLLERHDHSYRETKELNVNSKSGALVVPPSFNTLDQFQQMALELKKRHSNSNG